MRLPRMTTRRWMIVVAVVAMSLGGSFYAAKLMRRNRYLAMAAFHSSIEADLRESLARCARDDVVIGLVQEPEPGSGAIAAGQRRFMWGYSRKEREVVLRGQIDGHAALARKYQDAARYWLTVEPDPPEPE